MKCIPQSTIVFAHLRGHIRPKSTSSILTLSVPHDHRNCEKPLKNRVGGFANHTGNLPFWSENAKNRKRCVFVFHKRAPAIEQNLLIKPLSYVVFAINHHGD